MPRALKVSRSMAHQLLNALDEVPIHVREQIDSLDGRIGKSEWGKLQWDDKPTWAELLAAYHALNRPTPGNEIFLDRLRDECRRRISAAYGARDSTHEVEIRLSDPINADADAERERLRAKFAEIRDSLYNCSPEQLVAAHDAYWTAHDAGEKPVEHICLDATWE